MSHFFHQHRFLLRLALVIVPFLACDTTGPDPGDNRRFVRVNVQNTMHVPLAGAAVTIAGESVTTGSDGTTPEVLVSVGEVTVTVNASGYNAYSNTFNISGATTINIEVSGPNTVNGQVVNSQNANPVVGASVSFFRGTGSSAELLATTNSSGFFTITDAPNGTFRVCITATGFLEFCRDNVQIAGGVFTLDPIAIAEQPPAGSFRIVLTWGSTPSDLDSHLTGPDGSGGRFHVYYANTSAGGASLDHDDTSGNGPETITITTPRDGMYRYSVHNFSDQSAAGAGGIASSPTRVEVYSSTGLIKAYTAPAATSGNTWRVFEMTMSGTTPTFNDNGGASLGYVTASGPGDAGTFLTGGGDAPAPAKVPVQ